VDWERHFNNKSGNESSPDTWEGALEPLLRHDMSTIAPHYDPNMHMQYGTIPRVGCSHQTPRSYFQFDGQAKEVAACSKKCLAAV
jgi:hypothetical protein